VPAVPAAPGLTAVELFDALAAGTVRMVWIACTNPAQSMPDQATVRAGLARAELVVLQEAFAQTETAPYADVLLPATTWGEKDGTVTNSERRISRVRAALPALGESRHDWQIAVDFARRLEAMLRPGSPTLFPYELPREIFAEHVATTRGRDLDITGLDYDVLDRDGPQQWPYPAGATQGRGRLYTDGVFPTSDGRARFAAVRYAPVAEAVNAHHPFRLNTGRLRDQWHGMTRTGLSASLYAHAPEPALEMNPADLVRRQLTAGDLVRVESKHGNVIVPIVAAETGKPGSAYLPMHWGSATLAGRDGAGINAVTSKAVCPSSKQPELKHAAVRITKVELPWRLAAFGYAADDDSFVALRNALRAHAGELDFASVVLIGRERTGVFLRGAARAPMDPAWIADLDRLFGLDRDDTLRYDDIRRGIGRRIGIDAQRLRAVRLSGDVASEAWLRDWLAAGQDVAALRSQLMVPMAAAPRGFRARGRILCNCLDVAERDIVDALVAHPGPSDAALAAVQASLRCGTQCGSCVPELKRLAAAQRTAA